MSVGGRAQRSTVTPDQEADDDVPICAPKPSGSKEASAVLKSSVVPDLSARTISRMVAAGSFPEAASAGLVAAICGSSQLVMTERNMSARVWVVSTSGGSEAVTPGRLKTGTTAEATVGYLKIEQMAVRRGGAGASNGQRRGIGSAGQLPPPTGGACPMHMAAGAADTSQRVG